MPSGGMLCSIVVPLTREFGEAQISRTLASLDTTSRSVQRTHNSSSLGKKDDFKLGCEVRESGCKGRQHLLVVIICVFALYYVTYSRRCRISPHSLRINLA